ncbi:MAG: 2-hydroxychromene-2-carboxylate isomerase [Burkholderiaceae bacterium]|nr:2-hydroxychromene-2-carboxylate isomerase [Burkholderiaceae bacterium]
MPERVIRFYFDYVSPNAYLAWTKLAALAQQCAYVIEPVPVLFAGLLEAHRQLGPAEVPPKMRWMWTNIARKAAIAGIDLNPPAFHPFNPLLALRASSLSLAAAKRHTLISALFDGVWVRSLHISDPAVVEKIANEAGLDGRALIAQAQQPESKGRLRSQTDRAIAAGVFGVPTMIVGDELFWGYDDLLFLRRFMDSGGTDRGETSWVAPKPSAVRS